MRIMYSKTLTASVVAGTVQRDQVVATTGTAQATIPVDGDEPLTLDAPAQGARLEVNLPKEITTQDAQVADDGTVVYQGTGDSADATVQTLDDGAVRIQTVTQDADGQHEFTYTFGDGVVPIQTTDGSVELVQPTGDGGATGVAVVDQAWAVDAKGESVETRYEVVGDSLVQRIVPGPDTAYPIVADPTVRLGFAGTYISVYFSKNETATIAGSSAGALTVVNKIPNAIARTAVRAVVAILGGVAGTAAAQRKCLKVVVVTAGIPGANFPQVYSGGLCK